MRQLRGTFAPAFLLLLLLGCGRSDAPATAGGTAGDATAASREGMIAAPPRAAGRIVSRRALAAPAAAPAVDVAVSEEVPAQVPSYDPAAMVIRTASAVIEVHGLDTVVVAARRMAARFGGVVANAELSTGRNEVHRAVIQIKVPAARFDSLLAGLDPLGRVESVSVNAEDVGEEYVDIEARLANLRRLETRLVDLLAHRTGRLSDVLQVEHELARVRGEIDQIEGRRRYLQRSVALSTLALTLHEPEPVLAGTPGSNPIAAAFRAAWRNLVGSLAWGIAALGVVIPFGLFIVALALAVRWARRRFPALGAAAR